MSDNLEVNFNTRGATDAILHSPDGLLWADRVELDLATNAANFFNGKQYIGTIRWTGMIPAGGKLIISINAGFRVNPG